jgi:hypothetical protein
MTNPIEISEINADRFPRHIRTTSFIAEMSTLASIFLRQLPFALSGPVLDLLPLRSIYEYSYHYSSIMAQDSNRPDHNPFFTSMKIFDVFDIPTQDTPQRVGRL